MSNVGRFCLLSLNEVLKVIFDAFALLISPLISSVFVIFVIGFLAILAVDEALKVFVLDTTRMQVFVEICGCVSELVHLGC